MKLVYVGFSYQHHGEHSGYDQIKKTGIYDKIIDFQKSYDLYIKISDPNRNWYIRVFKKIFFPFWWWPEFYLFFNSFFNSGKYIYHIIYGENIIKFFGRFKFKNKIILTLHQPLSVLSQNNRFLKSLKRIDKIIVMSEEQELNLKKILPNVPIKYIPHGVDTNYFKQTDKPGNQLLQIGNWLRDFEFASNVYSYIEEIDRNFKVSVISRSKYHHYFASNKNVNCISDVSDNELLDFFQKSKVVFLPLKDFTANNSVIEAISCGCEVLIATDKKYWKHDTGYKVHFVELDVEKVAENIITLLNGSNDFLISNRKFIVENIDWKVIGLKTKSFIDNN